MKVFTSEKQKIGELGEKMAEMFLMKHGFLVTGRNFSHRAGEIDLIAEKGGVVHFIEVKTVTVTHETKINVSHETLDIVTHETMDLEQRRSLFIKENRKLNNPFQNVSQSKIKKFMKIAEIYLEKAKVPRETRWQLDGIGVYLDLQNKKARFQHLSNIGIL